MSSVQTVFGNNDLRREILSFLPKRCGSCHTKLIIINNHETFPSYKKYWCSKWKQTENKYTKHFCNWCCYYVFEHSI